MYTRGKKDNCEITSKIGTTWETNRFMNSITSSSVNDMEDDSPLRLVLPPSVNAASPFPQNTLLLPFSQSSHECSNTNIYTYQRTVSPLTSSLVHQHAEPLLQCDTSNTSHQRSTVFSDEYSGLDTNNSLGMNVPYGHINKDIVKQTSPLFGRRSSSFSTSSPSIFITTSQPGCNLLPHKSPVISAIGIDAGVSNIQPRHGRRRLICSADGVIDPVTRKEMALECQETIKQQIIERREKEEEEKRRKKEEDLMFEERLLRDHEMKSYDIRCMNKRDNNVGLHVKAAKGHNKLIDVTETDNKSINNSKGAEVKGRQREGTTYVERYNLFQQGSTKEEEGRKELNHPSYDTQSYVRQCISTEGIHRVPYNLRHQYLMTSGDQQKSIPTGVGGHHIDTPLYTDVDCREWCKQIQNRDLMIAGDSSSAKNNKIIDIFVRAEDEGKISRNNSSNFRDGNIRHASYIPDNSRGAHIYAHDINVTGDGHNCSVNGEGEDELECTEHIYI